MAFIISSKGEIKVPVVIKFFPALKYAVKRKKGLFHFFLITSIERNRNKGIFHSCEIDNGPI